MTNSARPLAASTSMERASREPACESHGFVWMQTLVVPDAGAGGEARAEELAHALLTREWDEVGFGALAVGVAPPEGLHGFRGPWTVETGIPRRVALVAQCAGPGTLVSPFRVESGWLVVRRMRHDEVSTEERLDASLEPRRTIRVARDRVPSDFERGVTRALGAFSRGVVAAAEAVAELGCAVGAIASGEAVCD